ncbi:MAG: methyltransferase domain-containing protein [Bacteroidales bacterium]|nr:methyltransferase domain-containing protein [Bacteroidales bacterium]
MSELFDEIPLWSAPFGLKLLDFVNYKPGITALDIGCGAGFPLLELAMRLGNSSKVYGIDPDSESLSLAGSKAETFGIGNIHLIKGVAEEIPLGDHSIDLIVSNNGINNVSDIHIVLNECARVLKPIGQFVLSINLDQTFIEFYKQLEEVLKEINLPVAIRQMHQHIYEKRRPLDEMLALMQQSGFQIKTVGKEEFSYRFTDATAMFQHHFIRTSFLPSWRKLLPETNADEILGEVESRMNEQVLQAGSLSLSVPFVVINATR